MAAVLNLFHGRHSPFWSAHTLGGNGQECRPLPWSGHHQPKKRSLVLEAVDKSAYGSPLRGREHVVDGQPVHPPVAYLDGMVPGAVSHADANSGAAASKQKGVRGRPTPESGLLRTAFAVAVPRPSRIACSLLVPSLTLDTLRSPCVCWSSYPTIYACAASMSLKCRISRKVWGSAT